MKEAMRCHPVVSLPLERVVPEGGAVLCGTHLDAGTIVGINPVVLHHDRAIFGEDAAEFRPERWIESDEKNIKNMDRHLMTVRMKLPKPLTGQYANHFLCESLGMAHERALGKAFP